MSPYVYYQVFVNHTRTECIHIQRLYYCYKDMQAALNLKI